MRNTFVKGRFRNALLAATVLAGAQSGSAMADIDDGILDNNGQLPLSTGQFVTATAATGAAFTKLNPGLPGAPNFTANGAIKTAVSPDGATLLVMTSGYNDVSTSSGTISSQYIFVYDITGANARTPAQKQVIQVPDTYAGLVWSPDGSKFYVSGGSGDKVYIYGGSTAAGWTAAGSVSMGHASLAAYTGGFVYNGNGFVESSSVAGLGLSKDGATLVAANIYNDSITVIDTATSTKKYEYDLRPYNTTPASGSAVAGGETPFTVAITGTSSTGLTAYVSSIRDREVVVVSLGATSASLVTRIALPGNPNSMVLSSDDSTLYVAQDNSDSVAVINTATNTVSEEISTIAPNGIVPAGTKYKGAAANGVALSSDNKTLFVTNGGANSVAIIALNGTSNGDSVSGLVPTAWYPHSVSLSHDNAVMYIANGKTDPGRNPSYETGSANQYILQLEGGGLLTVPVPGATDLGNLTTQVAANNGYSVPVNSADTTMMSFLHQHIQHVIYIIKENRTFDQVLGDLTNGANASAALTMYGKRVTPNFHAAAQNFVTLDNFFCSGEVSGNGWAWSTEARESDHGVKTIPPNYAGRGASNDSEGSNRTVNVGLPTATQRNAALAGLYSSLGAGLKGGAANLLPGTNDDFATDGPTGTPIQTGHIWDAALQAGKTVRNYGFFVDIVRYNIPASYGGLYPSSYPQYNYLRNPYYLSTLGIPALAPLYTVAVSTNPALASHTDPYFRGFDNAFPDVWRVEEWMREFNGYNQTNPSAPYSSNYVTNGNLPNLTLLRLMHDHTGNYSGANTAVAGLTTAELQQADNDLAVGRVIQTVANSPYASNTLIFVLEDDAQDGPDHMDAHRSTAYIVGPYVKQHAVVSTRYTTVNLVRTIGDILGLDHLNLNDAYQRPMTDVFSTTATNWGFTATASPYLAPTSIALAEPGLKFADNDPAVSPHDSAWWADATRGFDFTAADRVPADMLNEVLWEGAHPGVPYPHERSGADLRRRLLTEK